ncbi:hypothetical protein E2C01_055125 [Portunus trituberculatus]|uniref:Uncharacterized protein n=1 Tax=Portunus trituberculatus TaxID=210409 RepID=A0A5B7GQD0_PORTR|nr:hypothetical protein [Portunus trituberculatus]
MRWIHGIAKISRLYINFGLTPVRHSSTATSYDVTASHPMQHGPSHASPAGHALPHGPSHSPPPPPSRQPSHEYYTYDLEMNSLLINNLKIQLYLTHLLDIDQ